jgi:hypothetical protein
MLEFAEQVFFIVSRLRVDTEKFVTAGSVKDMEQYRFLMGRLEGYKFVEEAVKDLLSKNPNL